MTHSKLSWSLQTNIRFYGRVAYDTDYDGVALDESVGTRLAKEVDNAEVMFMGNHGVLTAATTVAQAYDDLYYLERSCQTQILAESSGRPLIELSQSLIEQTSRQSTYERIDLGYIDKHFEARKRLLARSGSTYRD